MAKKLVGLRFKRSETKMQRCSEKGKRAILMRMRTALGFLSSVVAVGCSIQPSHHQPLRNDGCLQAVFVPPISPGGSGSVQFFPQSCEQTEQR